MLFVIAAPPAPAPAQVSIGVAINIGPPAIPVYVQPPCPQPNYLWTPGYWAYGPYGYYWVPGAWVPAPYPGYLWTPGYWAWNSGYYAWHAGYWGRHVGFYGGINYGFGYFGVGFVGGGWYGNRFRYNTAVVNVNRTVIRNVYVDKTVINNNYYSRSRVAYNGGPGGIARRPLPTELAYAHETRIPRTAIQQQHINVALHNRNYLAGVNKGRPAEPAVARPLSPANRPNSYEPVTPRDRVHANVTGAGNSAYGVHPYRETHPSYAQNHPMRPAGPAHQPSYRQPGNGQPGYHHAPGNGGGHQPQHQQPAQPHPHGGEEHPGKPPRG